MTALPTEEQGQNITFVEQVIKSHPASPPASLPGHVVVVFETIGSGEEWRFDLREGQRAPKVAPWLSLVGKEPHYVAFAVTSEWQRSTTVTADVTMDISLHAFKLAIDLVYSVADARLLVTRRNADPLRRLRDEAARLMQLQFARREWERVRSDFRGIEREIITATLPRLQRLATDYGIDVREIALNHRLTQKDFDDIAKREEADRQALDDELAHERRKRLASFDRAFTKDGHEATVEDYEIKSKAEWTVRYSEMANAAAHSTVKAIEAAGSAIHSPAELAQAVGTIREAIEALRDLGNGGGARALPHASPSKAMLTAPQNGPTVVIGEFFGETEAMTWPALATKQKLQGLVLHLIGELILPDATDDTVTEHRERLSDARDAAGLTSDQYQYFGKYIDSDRLRRRLG